MFHVVLITRGKIILYLFANRKVPKFNFQREFYRSKIIRIFLIFCNEGGIRSTFFGNVNFLTNLVIKLCPRPSSIDLQKEKKMICHLFISTTMWHLILYILKWFSTTKIMVIKIIAFTFCATLLMQVFVIFSKKSRLEGWIR